MDHPRRFVTSMTAIRSAHPEPMTRALLKVLPRLDAHCRAIVALSPFCVVATRGPKGADASPRGDPPGFVRVVDDGHLLIPDRIGNNRFDSYENLIADPHIAILFFVPGMAEMLRIAGTARITDDPDVLAASAVQGRAPKLGLFVAVEEAMLHCAKAINRAQLWDEAARIDRSILPTYSQMLVDHVPGLTREESERQGAEMARRGMY